MALYRIRDYRIILYTSNIEDDIKIKSDVDVLYLDCSNVEMNIWFSISGKVNFRIARDIKKYFLDNIPYVVNVLFDNNQTFVVYLTREHKIDSLDCEIYDTKYLLN